MTEKKDSDIINSAIAFENSKPRITSTSERVIASKAAKAHILALNEIYKRTKDPELMELMKRLTAIKQRAEKRLKIHV